MKNKCKYCNRPISKKAKRCGSCEIKRRHKLGIINSKGKNNPSFKDGRTLEKHCCIDCKKEITNYTAKRCRKCDAKNKFRIKYNHPRWKNGKPKCTDCGKELSYYKGKRCEKCNKKYLIGVKSPNFVHGQGYAPYPIEFNDQLKLKIKKRDIYTCKVCGMTEEEHIIVYGIKLAVHHIDYNKMNCKEGNLISLCNQCNIRANYNKDYWFAYFMYIMENR